MSITRINEFKAKDGQGDALRELLLSFLVPPPDGCRAIQVLQSAEHPTRIVVIEVWDSREAHQASVNKIPPDALARTMPLLAAPPTGEYFQT